MTVSQIALNFAKAAPTYDQYCQIQKKAADILSAQLLQIIESVPDGPVLEIGCGTGLLSEQLTTICPERELIISDIAEPMLEACRHRIEARTQTKLLAPIHDLNNSKIKFKLIDGENIDEIDRYSLIVSSFTFHWFNNINKAVFALCRALKPGGILLLSVPTECSLSEWKDVCLNNKLIFTGNSLPYSTLFEACAERLGYPHSFSTVSLSAKHKSSIDFFRSLKKLGASSNLNRNQSAGYANMRRVLYHWDSRTNGPVKVSFDIMTGWIKKV